MLFKREFFIYDKFNCDLLVYSKDLVKKIGIKMFCICVKFWSNVEGIVIVYLGFSNVLRKCYLFFVLFVDIIWCGM